MHCGDPMPERPSFRCTGMRFPAQNHVGTPVYPWVSSRFHFSRFLDAPGTLREPPKTLRKSGNLTLVVISTSHAIPFSIPAVPNATPGAPVLALWPAREAQNRKSSKGTDYTRGSQPTSSYFSILSFSPGFQPTFELQRRCPNIGFYNPNVGP